MVPTSERNSIAMGFDPCDTSSAKMGCCWLGRKPAWLIWKKMKSRKEAGLARAKCSWRKLRLENYGAAMKSRVFCVPPTPRSAPRDGLPRACRDLTGKTQESRRVKSEPTRLTSSEQIQSKLRSLRL